MNNEQIKQAIELGIEYLGKLWEVFNDNKSEKLEINLTKVSTSIHNKEIKYKPVSNLMKRREEQKAKQKKKFDHESINTEVKKDYKYKLKFLNFIDNLVKCNIYIKYNMSDVIFDKVYKFNKYWWVGNIKYWVDFEFDMSECVLKCFEGNLKIYSIVGLKTILKYDYHQLLKELKFQSPDVDISQWEINT